MKKSTQKNIFLLFMGLVLVISTVGIIVLNQPVSQQQQGQELKPLSSFLVEGEIDPQVEQVYRSAGFTFLKYYYVDFNHTLDQYLSSLPDSTRTTGNEIQLVVQKIQSERKRVIIIGPYGQYVLENNTETEIFSTLCQTLAIVPPECGLSLFNNQTK